MNTPKEVQRVREIVAELVDSEPPPNFSRSLAPKWETHLKEIDKVEVRSDVYKGNRSLP